MHDRMLRQSPLREGDLLRSDTLDRYVFRLNRHPGRRVDAALAPGGSQADELDLDYLIYEPKPWTLYAQLSNTGTEFTDEWRQRFGFIHNQLTGRDDILRLDYLTTGFDDSHTVIGSYEFPLMDGKLRVKPYGSYQEYTASDVGFAGEEFEGTSWQAGLEGALNVFQRRASFIDVVAGFRWEGIKVRNALAQQEGNDDFFIVYGGGRFERFTDRSGTLASAILEANLADLAGTDPAEIERMGRSDVDEDFVVFKYDLEHSFFLEPVLFRDAWRGEAPVDPAMGRGRGQTLAHELAFMVRGQEALGSRLIPNFQTVLGGLYTVRGYDESLAPGDSSTLFSVEYRFHVPRALSVNPQPSRTVFGEPFRFRPTGPYGVTDWDLILKGFFDIGRVRNTDLQAQVGESDQTLSSVGVGLNLEFKQNLRVRVDWGFVLQDAESGNRRNESGDHRVHFEGTLFY
jgi:hemolysin activation/secretion protein